MNARDVLKVVGVLVCVVVSLAIALVVCSAIGAMILAATMTLVEADQRRLAFVFNGIPWMFVLARFVRWLTDNLKRQSEDRLGWKEES